MPDLRLIVPLLLGAQALLVSWSANREVAPPPPDLSRFPSHVREWKQYRGAPVEHAIQAQLGADSLFNRGYFDASSGSEADLLVAWFRSQLGGSRQPHSPKVCLPGAGWVSEQSAEITIPTAAGDITAARDVLTKGTARSVVLYWFQTSRRAVGNEWAAKFWVVADSLRDRRTDTALVRIVVPSENNRDTAAASAALAFAKEIYPLLKEYLPR
ncbi:MAG: exosortase C-terminal domain/associated protein EpsI [Bryobacteraceae bacterium]